MEARGSLAEYSWSELAEVSALIAQCEDEATAQELARTYHLVGDDGAFDTGQTKDVKLSDGTVAHVAIAGIRHDVAADAATPLGLSFIFADAVAREGMAEDSVTGSLSRSTAAGVGGGWDTCTLREWLAEDFSAMLPGDLNAVLAPASKANVCTPRSAVDEDTGVTGGELLIFDENGYVGTGDGGESEDVAIADAPQNYVERSADKLWLLSATELYGASAQELIRETDDVWSQVTNLEGGQYQLFADAAVRAGASNDMLVRRLAGQGDAWDACSWWLRTPYENSYFSVGPDGRLEGAGEELTLPAASKQGVVVGFCI